MTYRIEFPHNTGLMVKVDGSAEYVASQLTNAIGIKTLSGALYNSKQFLSVSKVEPGTTTVHVPNLTDVLVR